VKQVNLIKQRQGLIYSNFCLLIVTGISCTVSSKRPVPCYQELVFHVDFVLTAENCSSAASKCHPSSNKTSISSNRNKQRTLATPPHQHYHHQW